MKNRSDEELVINDPELLACNAKVFKDDSDLIRNFDSKR